MKSDQDLVKEFHEAFGLPVRTTPDVGSAAERVLRVRLILEEALGFAKASGVLVRSPTGGRIDGLRDLVIEPDWHTADLTQMAHELGDLGIVVNGSAVQLGIPLRACMNEIHAANMNKLGPDGKPIIDQNGKVRKPEGWKPADVSAVLRNASRSDDHECDNCLGISPRTCMFNAPKDPP